MSEQTSKQAATTAPLSIDTSKPLAQLEGRIKELLAHQAEHKAISDQASKGLNFLGVKIGTPFTPAKLPITPAFIVEVINLLRPGGMKIKDFQRGLNIFDLAELNRKRKALVMAGVTKEKENYLGTNMTFVELTDPYSEDGGGRVQSTCEEDEADEPVEDEWVDETPPGGIVPVRVKAPVKR